MEDFNVGGASRKSKTQWAIPTNPVYHTLSYLTFSMSVNPRKIWFEIRLHNPLLNKGDVVVPENGRDKLKWF